MTFEQYLQDSARFDIPGQDYKDKMENAIMGLLGEGGELCDLYKKEWFHGHPHQPERVKGELGDVLWYFGLFCRALSSHECGQTPRLQDPSGCFRRRTPWNPDEYKRVAQSGGEARAILFPYLSLMMDIICQVTAGIIEEDDPMQALFDYICIIAAAEGFTLEDIMEGNMKKLSARYPNGFETERSLHRAAGDL